jgi:4-diphosphocytidyl-2C-methyl-D-erythritol kinase
MDFEAIESMLYNDLQETAAAKKKVILRLIERLASILNIKAIVSGSGPSVFCLYSTRKEAIKAKKKLFHVMPERGRKRWQVFIARTV